jgi:glycosyltransferase involved in cell wall biosynthesis
MKLIIQIPCYNEEETLPLVFEKMPTTIPGIDVIEYQIIDDGSSDRTVEIARQLGVHHIISYRGKNRRWLGRAFKLGIANALAQGADILVNTDGDNQYPSERIPDLVAPILAGKAEIVIGDRNTSSIAEFSLIKKFLQRLGSFTAQILSGSEVRDSVSGFRAYSKTAMLKINITTNYTYTIDTLMQANKKGLDIVWLPIKVNAKTRDSRLITSILSKVRKSGTNIVRMFIIYEPVKTFLGLSWIFFIVGFILIGRFLYFYFQGNGDGFIQSVVIGGISILVGFQLVSLSIIAELLSVNRKLIEDVLEKVKQT